MLWTCSNDAAGFFGVLGGGLERFGHQVVTFGMREDHVHAEAGHQGDDGLRNGQRLAVAGGVGPGHGDFFTFEVFQGAEGFLEVQQVGHRLRGMIEIALQVDDGGALRQDAFFEAFFDGGSDFDHVFVAFAEENIVADADRFGDERNHVGGFADGFAVGDLRLAFVEFLQRQAQQSGGAGEREAGAGGLIAEIGDRNAAVEDAGADVGAIEFFEGLGHEERGLQIVGGALPGEEEIFLVQGRLQRSETVEKWLDSFGHFFG